ncbi:MAG TPA: twin-arginine translocation signal domain-containing protein [Gemmatimonadaceae bacterium]|nr:twin-arginine translocation signal domain-containing protein [Gemmatimonadaceae bacterium]
MSKASLPERRQFLGKLAAGAVAFGMSGSVSNAIASELKLKGDVQPSDKWLTALTGKHREIFDMPNHENGWGLLHVRNYLNTLRDTYKVTHPEVTAVATIYGMGTMLAFNDDMWKKYGLGNASKVMDASNAPATSNVFYKAPGGSNSLSIGGTPIPIPADSSISELQQRGTVFILCNNAYNVWMGLLAGGDATKAAALRKEFDANILPGVYLVPAMVVAIDQAQKHGCSYIHV